MKDKIKRMLTKVFCAVNLPFFAVRAILAFVPMILATSVYHIYEDDDEKSFRLIRCIFQALWMSGPIGVIHTIMRWAWFDICIKDDIDASVDLFREKYLE